jgi:hypothetical protein
MVGEGRNPTYVKCDILVRKRLRNGSLTYVRGLYAEKHELSLYLLTLMLSHQSLNCPLNTSLWKFGGDVQFHYILLHAM